MSGFRVVAFALLLAVVTAGGFAVGATQGGQTMSVQTVENGSNYLGPNASDVDRSRQGATSLDAAVAVRANAGGVRATFSAESVKRKYLAAANDTDRRRVVRSETDRLARHVEVLERREAETIEGYAAGDLDEADLFRRLAIIDGEANTRADTAAWLQSRAAADLDMGAESGRLSTLRIRLLALCGPVRRQVGSGINGSETSRVQAEAASGGLVLATVDRNENGDDVYVREAYTPAIRTRGNTARYAGNLPQVAARIGELYPWVNNRTADVGIQQLIGGEGAKLYSMEVRYDGGRVTPYLDGGTDRVEKEEQRQRIVDLPTDRRNATGGDGELDVTVRMTYASGPLGVNATNPATNRTVNATVFINDDRVGPTKSETLWTVAPRGPANVTVVHGDSRVTTTVRAG
jgi:hypothetical protein